jgi:hypothetical protein
MAKGILATSSHSSNPVSSIAYLIHAAFEQRSEFSADSDSYKYQQSLSTLLGLAFTAILSENSRVESYRPHFDLFLRCRNSIQDPDNLEIVSVSIAEIVCGAIYPFHVLQHPRYYDDFIKALLMILKPSNVDNPEIEKEIKVLLQELFKQCQ